MQPNPHGLSLPICALSHWLKKRPSTLCVALTKWRPCRSQEKTTATFLFFSVFGQREEVCNRGAEASNHILWVCNGQDPLFKPCTSLSYLRHTEQKHKTAGQSGSQFTSHATLRLPLCQFIEATLKYQCRQWFHKISTGGTIGSP